MAEPVVCSGCGGLDDLAVVQAGAGREFTGPLRVLIYCVDCRAHPERTAPSREAVKLELVTEALLLSWYPAKTMSDPEIVAAMVWGERRPEFIAAAKKVMAARSKGETS